MTIGVPKEIKSDEYRVGLTPSNVRSLVQKGHKLFIQSGAGIGSGFDDLEYKNSGAILVDGAKLLYNSATLIIKVKEPQSDEYELLNSSHTLFCYLHLAPLRELASALVKNGVCAIAYETIAKNNSLPLLKPMSDIAGKMAPTVAAYHLSKYQGGEGILISGAEGVEPANVLVIGAGNAGFNAVKIATGMGANVTVINRSLPKMQELTKLFPKVKTEIYSPQTLLNLLKEADIIISTVLIHGGATTPKLITRDMLKQMKSGSVLVDITIDQGGISESSRATTHTKPVFIEEGVIHYCVANMPGAYPKTATIALTNATLPYILELAENGTTNAIKNDSSLALGVNVYKGVVTNKAVAKALNFNYKDLKKVVNKI